jgi:hypothetical protein
MSRRRDQPAPATRRGAVIDVCGVACPKAPDAREVFAGPLATQRHLEDIWASAT